MKPPGPARSIARGRDARARVARPRALARGPIAPIAPTPSIVPSSLSDIDDETFSALTTLIRNIAGISLGPHKRALVCARVSTRMRQLQMSDFGAYYRLVEQDTSGNEVVHLLNAISTNVTQFFRERHHFEILTRLASEWERAGQKRFRIWSAAASTGEEAYTIAMTLREALNDCRDAKVLATDISTKVIALAREGVYDDRLKDAVPPPLLLKYFEPRGRVGDLSYAVKEELKRMIVFGRINLSDPPFPLKGPLDAVFCRNVMIYFDNDVRRRLLAELYRLVRPGGYLFVGHAESLCGMLSEFKSVAPSVYYRDR